MEQAYGAGKAGAAFDPIQFAQRPQVIFKGLCLLFGVIIFGCISREGWLFNEKENRELCLYNSNSSACQYGEAIGLIAFFAAIAFLIGEFLFEQMSSVKTRKHFVLGDLGFSGAWCFLNFIGFCYLTNQWSKSETPPDNYGVNNVQAAIAFSFFSIFSWAGSGWFAFQRFKQGTTQLFANNFEGDAAAGTYSSYSQDAYQDPPFSNNQTGGGEYPAPTY